MSRLEKLQAFLAQDPNDSFTQYAIGLEYASAKEYFHAIKTMEDLRERDPGYVPTYYQLADYYRKTAAPEKAREIYTVGIQKAREAKDLHAVSELEAALDELNDETGE